MAELEELSPTIKRLRRELGAEFEREMERVRNAPPTKSTWSGGHRPNSKSRRKAGGQPSRVQTYLALTLQTQHDGDDE